MLRWEVVIEVRVKVREGGVLEVKGRMGFKERAIYSDKCCYRVKKDIEDWLLDCKCGGYWF